MLFNEEFAFVHFPKTAGKSLTKYLIGAWKDPIYGSVSPGQMREVADVMRPGVTLEIARGHENMRRTAIILGDRGKRIQDLRAVFVCLRNPYDIAVSTYFYMRENFPHNRYSTRFRMATEMGFEEFWCNDRSDSPPERWLTLGGTVLCNQRFIRFESIREDLRMYAEAFGFRATELPHLNRSGHGHYSDYMTDRSEEAVFQKFRYMFDAGYYARESFSV